MAYFFGLNKIIIFPFVQFKYIVKIFYIFVSLVIRATRSLNIDDSPLFS